MSERNEFSSQMQSLFQQVEEQQQQRESQRKRRERRKRLGLTAAVFALGLAPVLVYLGYPAYQEATRRRVANQFIRAVERGDGETLCTLVTSDDLRHFKLTPPKAAAVVNALFDGLPNAQAVRVRRISPSRYDAYPDQRHWCVYWGDAESGSSFPGKWREETMRSTITVKPTPEGFRVDFQVFLLDTCLSRWGQARIGHAMRFVRQRAGI
jgi:hypothetical protein